MAILGIDFGTTNTVVSYDDRGSYPIVPHYIQTRIGRVSHEVFPSLIYIDRKTGEVFHGLEAERLIRAKPPEAGTQIRSIKRMLRDYTEGMRIDPESGHLVKDMLIAFLKSLRASICAAGLFMETEVLECIITWPAHANGAQRAITRDVFRGAGFEVIGSLNEPTASAIEYADRVTGGNTRAARKLTDTIAVFDFGGGTLDVSLLDIEKGAFRVVDNMGREQLGGDDLDQVLCEMFASKMKIELESLTNDQRLALLNQARHQKESIGNQGAKSLLLNPQDLGLKARPVSIATKDFLKRVRPIIEQAVDTLHELMQRKPAQDLMKARPGLGAIYLVGGSSKLPLVEELVSKRFEGVKTITTHKPFTSVAVGAAIYASQKVEVRDIFSRHFGVFRLLEAGQREFFDPIFEAGTRLPAKGEDPIEKVAVYNPAHNIGHLKYLECSDIGPDGLPRNGVRSWSDILFPYDPAIEPTASLEPSQIQARSARADTMVEERYRVDHDGVITVEMSRVSDGKKRRFEIYLD